MLAGEEPAAPTFIINAAAPHAVGFIRVDLHLIPVHAAFGDFPRLAIAEIHGGIFGKHVGPDLHARVEAVIAQVLVFEHEIPIEFLGAHERIRCAGHRCADDCTLFYRVLSHPALLGPTRKILAVKQSHRVLIRC